MFLKEEEKKSSRLVLCSVRSPVGCTTLWWGSEACTLPQKLGKLLTFEMFPFCVCWRVVYSCGLVGEHCEVVGELGWLVGEVRCVG